MGGLMFILGIGVAIVTAGWEEIQRGNFIYLFVYLFALVFGAIGFVDDFQKLRHHANAVFAKRDAAREMDRAMKARR